jgi:hypothetical protein
MQLARMVSQPGTACCMKAAFDLMSETGNAKMLDMAKAGR